MRKHFLAQALAGATLFSIAALPMHAQRFSGNFSGFNELGALNAETGAILSDGQGTIKLRLDKSAGTITYELSYSGLSANVTQSHIHFGRVHTPGGVMVFLCTNLGNGPAGTPACPPTGGTVSGTISAVNVIGPVSQHVTPGDFQAVTKALFARAAYANIHTMNFPAGEIRAEVRRDHGDDDQDSGDK